MPIFEQEYIRMTSVKHLLIIGTVWPEPNSSAAGSRMLQLIDLFQELDYDVSFASPTLKTEHAFDLNKKGVSCFEIQVNTSKFDSWIKKINPTHVMFDRFMMEEQFGWRVAEHCPNAFRILDTEDLHCLRKTRQACFKAKKEFTIEHLKNTEITKREIASISRSDLSLMISEYEMNILLNHFQIPNHKVFYLPFLVTEELLEYKPYAERQHFMTIGSFRHDPNVDSVMYLKKKIWPLIRKQLPLAELHIYGSYPKQSVTQLHNPKEGFLVKGWAEDIQTVVENARVMLAPLRFGAGQKGKFIDSLKYGTPSVTTSIGIEGMGSEISWSGCIADDVLAIVNKAVELHENEALWNRMQKRVPHILKTMFSKSNYIESFERSIIEAKKQPLPFYQEALNYHSFKNSRFMSKWIEEKNKD